MMNHHKIASAYRDMTAREYAALKGDIAKHGLRDPIVTFQGEVLDGRHRQKACVELGIAAKYIEFTGTEDDARHFADSKNGYRRHLTKKEQIQMVQIELQRDPAQSDRAIGEKARVDHKTVAKARAEAASNGEIPHKTDDRKEASGRKARGRKAKSETTTKRGAKKRKVPTLSDAEYRRVRQVYINSVVARCTKVVNRACGDLLGTDELEMLRDAVNSIIDKHVGKACGGSIRPLLSIVNKEN